MVRKNAVWILFKTVIIMMVTISLIYIGYKGYLKVVEWLPSFQKTDIGHIYEGIHDDYTFVLLEDQPLVLDHYPKMVEDKIYLPIDFVIAYLNPNFFWDANENTLTYTTLNDVIRMKTDELTYFVNDEPLTLNLPIRVFEDGVGYIPSDLLNQFSDYEMAYSQELDLLTIDDRAISSTFTTIKVKEAVLRVDPNSKSPYILKLQTNERVKIYGESDNWYKVRTGKGYMGYIKKKTAQVSIVIPGIEKVEEVSPFDHPKDYKGKLNLVWHQVTNLTANNYVQDLVTNEDGLDVLSPTWFSLSDSEGTISNLADISYVNWAHEQGIQVWALLSNFGILSNSESAIITHDVLNSTIKREKLIKQLLALCALYKLDGINIDFENVPKEDGPAYVEFMKELGPYLNKQGIIVSVDMYVPAPWTAHYNRSEVAKSVDYVMVMAYDEHWSTSPESGSVASIGFVEEGIINTLKEVAKEKIVLGLPYYTRIWAEQVEAGLTVVSSKAYGMTRAYEILMENNAQIIWDDTVKQYYGTYILEGITYKCWLEEEKSIEEKLNLMQKYELAGIAGWKLGLEKPEIWDVLKTYLKQ